MFAWNKMFIVVAIIYHTWATVSGIRSNESDNCDCDVLQINDSDTQSSTQRYPEPILVPF